MKSFKKKCLLLSLIFFLFFISLIYVLNLKVTYQQGINYEVHSVRIPLYFKLLTFINRHYSYKLLVEQIVNRSDDERTKILKLFKWTHQNIRKTPEGFPIIDDHVLNIIIRGYGVSDQSADVFAVLSNYAGIKAFLTLIINENGAARIHVAYVFIDQTWSIFDPYRGNYFINEKNNLASLDELKRGLWTLKSINKSDEEQIDYSAFFKHLPAPEEVALQRSNVQSPLNRILFELNNIYN